MASEASLTWTRNGVTSRVTPATEMTVEEWVRRYYKPDRLNREPDSAERIVEDRKRDMELYGEAVISHHDAVTGYTEWYASEAGEALEQPGKAS